mgnify:CR=1 FL=1
MDGWMDERTDGRTDGCMDAWLENPLCRPLGELEKLIQGALDEDEEASEMWDVIYSGPMAKGEPTTRLKLRAVGVEHRVA